MIERERGVIMQICKNVQCAVTTLLYGCHFLNSKNITLTTPSEIYISGKRTRIYSERQKYGINSLKIKQNFFEKNLWTGQF
jgi:hypothetical protein